MKTAYIIFLSIFLFAGFSCQTGEDLQETDPPATENPEQPGTDPDNPPSEEDITVETSGIEINPESRTILSDEWTQNISVLDSADFNLQINETLIQKYNLKTGTILVSDKGDGFLRKIKNISTDSNGKSRIETEACSLEELFIDGNFRISTKTSRLRSGEVEISKRNVWSLEYNSNIMDISGEYTFGNTMDISFSFRDSRIQTLSLSAGFINQLELNAGVKVSGDFKKYLFVKRLPRITAVVGGAPVVIVPVIAVYVGAEITGKPAPLDFNFLTGYSSNVTVSYDGQWHYTTSKDYYQTFQEPELVLNDKSNARLKVYIEPMLEFKIYGVLSPYFTLTGYGQIEAGYTKNPAWTAYVGAELGGGIKAKIFSKNLFDFNASFFEVKIPVCYAENELSIASGNTQGGISGKKLPKPLVVKVSNTFGYPLPGYKVQFKNTAGGGRLSRTEATTNSNGEASVELTLDKEIVQHQVEAGAIEKNETPHKGEPLNNSPVRFFASAWDEEIDETTWTFELKSSQGMSSETITCILKGDGVAQIIGRRDGTWTLSNTSLTVNWVDNLIMPPGCTYQLKGVINGAVCSGTYTHWDYDDKGVRFVWDSGTFSGYLSAAYENGDVKL
jgi:hypothetical protein